MIWCPVFGLVASTLCLSVMILGGFVFWVSGLCFLCFGVCYFIWLR